MDKKDVIFTNPALAMVNKVQTRQAELAGQEKPVDEKKQNVKQEVKQNVKHIDKRKTGIRQKYLEKQDNMTKGVTMTLRVTPGIKEQFDSIRNFYGYSQSDFLSALLGYAREQAVKDGWSL